MDNVKVLEDYLNQSVQYAYDDYRVLNLEEGNGRIICLVSFNYGNDRKNDLIISLFDLISFVYSKISV
jgi:hypothetical protein